MNSPLSILHLEDDPTDAWLVERSLHGEGIASQATVVNNRAAFEAALAEQAFDVVLADYRLPGFDGLEALRLIRARDPYKPFIFVTGFLGEEQAVEMLKSGATDFVLKDHLSRLGLAVRRARAEAQEHRRREQTEKSLREGLSRVTRMMTADHLAASLAHELRQPLAAILANAEAAKRFLDLQPPDLNEVRGAVLDIIRSDERANQVIHRLCALYGRAGQERTFLDLNKLVEETLSLLRSELVVGQVSCGQQLAAQLPLVAANRVEMQQVLMNLIFNARDAMSANDPASRHLVVATARDDPSLVRVSVSDSGSGITSEAAARLFEPFFTTKDTGMGMGLAISRSLIEAHGGRLWAVNNPAPGATFHFTLPTVTQPSP